MQVPADSITGLVSIRDSGWHGLASTTCEWQEPLGRLWKGFGMRVMTLRTWCSLEAAMVDCLDTLTRQVKWPLAFWRHGNTRSGIYRDALRTRRPWKMTVFLHMLVSWLCFPLTAHAWSIACMHGKHIDGSTCAHEWTTSWHAYHSKLLNFHRKQAMLHLNIMPMRFNVPTSACSSLKPVLTFAPMEKGLQPLFCPQWAEKYQPEKRQKIGIQCPAWIQDQAWLWMLECTTSPLCFVIYQAAENDMEVVNTVSDGDCLLDAFITSSFSNKKIASGALWTCFWLACCSFSLFCKSACSRPRSLRRAPWTTIRQSKTKEEKIRACRKVGVDWVDPWLHTLFEYYFHDQTLTG